MNVGDGTGISFVKSAYKQRATASKTMTDFQWILLGFGSGPGEKMPNTPEINGVFADGISGISSTNFYLALKRILHNSDQPSWL